MTKVSRADFVAHHIDQPLPTQELAAAQRLKGVDVRDADRDGDGLIAGETELRALWLGITDELTVETREKRKSFPFGQETVAKTAAGERLEAVESFRMAALRAKEAAAQGDAYARSGTLQHGPAKGEPLDAAKARPVARLGEAEKIAACRVVGVDPDTIGEAFANLRHHGEFYVALVPKDAVRDVYLMLESFPAPVPAAHAMLRFALADDKPAVLVPQDQTGDPTVLSLPDLVFSSEALGQPGWSYDLLRGQKGHFGLVDRFESLEDRFRHVESYSPKHPVTQHRVALSSEQKQDVLRAAVTLSEDRGFSGTYNTLERSCTTEAFLALDRGVGDDVPVHVKLARLVTGERVPTLSPTYLSLRGIAAKGETPTLLSEEMARAPRTAVERSSVA